MNNDSRSSPRVVSRSVGTATKTATKATDEALSTAKAATTIAAAQTNAALSLMGAGNAMRWNMRLLLPHKLSTKRWMLPQKLLV